MPRAIEPRQHGRLDRQRGDSIRSPQAPTPKGSSGLAEVRRTCRAPNEEISAPLSGEPDFTGDRLRIQEVAQQKRMAVLNELAQTAEHLARSGIIAQDKVEAARAEVDAATHTLRTIRARIGLRQLVLAGDLAPYRAVLLDMRQRAELDRDVADVRMAAARRDLARVKILADRGLASTTELAAASSALESFETARALALNRLDLIDERLNR